MGVALKMKLHAKRIYKENYEYTLNGNCVVRQIFLGLTSILLFRLDALALSVIATATWLGGWVAGWVAGCLSQPVLYQND